MVNPSEVQKTAMDIPRFSEEQLHPKLLHQDIGDAFQKFIHELLLSDYPYLHLFPSKGKDGAIDLSQTPEASRTVVECKFIGKDEVNEAQTAWRNVAKKLEKHLAEPDGPTSGQAQYRPWYRTDQPIREYIFYISSLLANQNQIDQLKQEITDFFMTLSSKYEHLRHLKGLSVEVFDWNDCCTKLKKQPHLIFRWFPLTRPQGLVPLHDVPDRGTFRSYLSNEMLAYYSIGQHLKLNPSPAEMDIPDEENLLSLLEGGDITGLVVTGSGGIGKSRLTLEIGRLAQDKGWLVLRVQTRLREDALEQLAERIIPDTPVLLLVDYIETQRDFTELIESLNDLNDTYSLQLRYIANCRTSFYQTVEATSRHRRVDLSPIVQEPYLNWFKEYRLQLVRHILEFSGLEVTEDNMAVCHDIPTLAVFVSYLHSEGRQTDLSELLKEADFGTWVAKRVQLSFGEKIIHRDLALLMAQFPMPFDITFHHDQENQRLLFDILSADGWIEKLPSDELHEVEMWVTGHDILADQILLSYFRSIPHTIEQFVDELLFKASKMDCLRSTLLTLQRLIDQPELRSLNFSNILDRKIADNTAAWREVRDMLTRTPLMTPLERIALLGKHEEFWKGVDKEIDFQNTLGWLIKWAMNQEESELDPENRSTLYSWLEKVTQYTTRSNYILTWGLRFNTEAVCKPALEWIRSRPVQFQTHYLMVAWMECHLPLDDISLSVQQWASKFKSIPHLSFVAQCWLDAGGEKELVQDQIVAWLEEHKTDPEARFVYRAWLEADGEKELVQDQIVAWLEKYKTDSEAGFVYRAWLEADGEKELVQDQIVAWLDKHKTDPEAQFVYNSWLKASGSTEMILEYIMAWLEKHKTDPEAQFVFKAWLDAGGEKEFIQDQIEAWLEEHKTEPEAGFVYNSWLKANGSTEMILEYIMAWLEKHCEDINACFIYDAWIERDKDFSVIGSYAIQWLSRNRDKGEAVYLTKFLAKQRGITVGTVKDILMWCQSFPDDGLWRLTQLKRNLYNKELGEEVVNTSETVLRPLILHDYTIPSVITELINSLFSYLISAPKLRFGQLRTRVDMLLMIWLRNPASFGSDINPHINLQRRNYFQRIIDLIVSEDLDVVADRKAIERFLYWVNNWELKRKSQLDRKIHFLKNNYPEPGLWDIINIR